MPSLAKAVPMPLDGSWVSLLEEMEEGEFFSGGPWEWNSSVTVIFDITDWAVITDVFEVYDQNILVLTTTPTADWTSSGVGPFDPPYTTDPDVAWVTAAYSKGSLAFAPGFHSVTIKNISIPPFDGDIDFIDGTVAFRASEVPEPATLLLLGSGMTGLLLRRRRTRS
jgi:hypothetical protein